MIMPGLKDEVAVTGGQIDAITMALVDASYDKTAEVRNIVSTSLYDIGKKRPELVLSSCKVYLRKHEKLQTGHRIAILLTMEKIVKSAKEDLPPSLAVDLIKLASDELTKDKEVRPEWQTAASSLLVALGCQFCNQVMEELLLKFQPGVLPHYFVVQTMSSLASANVFGMVPYLTAILGTMLPMLGMAKQDNTKWVFAKALANFSEAVLDYTANIDKAPDPTVKKHIYSTEIYSAYDMLFNVWLQSKEAKLRVTIVEAVGYMVHLMVQDRLAEQLPRLLQGTLSLYRKHSDHYYVTKGLCNVLDASVADGITILEPHLDLLLNTLHPQVCIPPDYCQPLTIKNHNELLRCFATLTTVFSDRLVAYLLQRLENNNEKNRIGTLSIIKHLVNSSGAYLENKKPLLVSGMKILLHENNNKVKKMVAQVVIAMGHHGYLELEGGNSLVEFIVRQCALTNEPQSKKSSQDPEYVSNEALRQLCESVLNLVTTTVDIMEKVLWPYLLEFVVPPQYTEAVAITCKSAAHLASNLRESESHQDYALDYTALPNIPRPVAILARLLILSGRPEGGRKRGTQTLTLLQAMGPNINADLVELWEGVIPKLLVYLEENMSDPDKWSQKSWEDLMLKFLSKTLDTVDTEEWTCELGSELGKQVEFYHNLHEEKNFFYKCLGIIMKKATTKSFVNKHLGLMFSTVSHTNQTEKEGCGIGLGFCASSHLDMALTKLETISKEQTTKKPSGLLGFIKDKSDSAEVERIKSTLMLCYGYLTLYAPVDLIPSRLEASILRNINPHFSNIKDTGVKQNLIRSVDLIGRSLHPDHLGSSYNFVRRTELMNHMQLYIRQESTKELTSSTRALAMRACATLVKLDPPLTEADTFDLIKTSTDSVYSLPERLFPARFKEEPVDVVLEYEDMGQELFDCLHSLLCETLPKNPTPGGLHGVFKHLEPWITSSQGHERQRSMESTSVILLSYLDILVKEGEFTNLGLLLARMVPRCTDPILAIRQVAFDCVQLLLKIHMKYEGYEADHKDQMVDALPTLKERVMKDDPNVLFSVVNDLSKVLSKKVPSSQLKSFVEVLLDGLVDTQEHSSNGACVVLNSLFKSRGHELVEEVDELIKALHARLVKITACQTRTGTLRSIRTLSNHHLSSVVSTLLNYPVPYDEHVVDCWKIIGREPQLSVSVIDQLLDQLNRGIPYEERVDPKTRKVLSRTVSIAPLSTVHALTEVFRVEESSEVVSSNFHRLFSSLVVYLGAVVGMAPPKSAADGKGGKAAKKSADQKGGPPSMAIKPSGVAVTALRELFNSTKLEDLLTFIDEKAVWADLEEEERYQDGITVLTMGLTKYCAMYLAKIVACLSTGLNSLYDPQRIVVAAMYAELINQRCAGDLPLVELLMNNLLGRLVDSSHVVRKLCIRGMGNIASVGKEQVQKYCTTVLSALMAGMDDREDPEDDITLEAMSGLSKILSEIDENNIRAILINIALRIRPCFEKEKAGVRAAAFTLFGNLSRFASGPSLQNFLEQVHTNFVSLLLHLNDKDPIVVEACKFALRQLGPVMKSESVNEMFQKHLIKDAYLQYGEFMYNLSKVIITDFQDKVSYYVMGNVTFFKSTWSIIRGNAAMFVGFLLGNLPHSRQSLVSKEHICGALILLLKDQSPEVRKKAAEAMSLLYEY